MDGIDAIGDIVVGGAEAIAELGSATVDPGLGVAPVPTRKTPLLVFLLIVCITIIPFLITRHARYINSPRLSRIVFKETDNGIEAELRTDREVREHSIIFNVADAIIGPTPALKIQEHKANNGMREVSYRAVDSAIGLPIRARVINVDAPHTDSGLRDLIRLISDDKMNAYLNSAADELQSHGYIELAEVTRIGQTQVVHTDRNLFGTSYAIWAWILSSVSLVLLAMILWSVIS
jgi:hypothetical protein